MSSRDTILRNLRQNRPFDDAPPRPHVYIPVVNEVDPEPEALVERFVKELIGLKGEATVVKGEAAARKTVLKLLKELGAARVLAWDQAHIPLPGLLDAVREAGVEIVQQELHDEFRTETLATAESAGASITGAEAAIAATGTLVVRTAPGRGRTPTVLAPVHIVVLRAAQIVPRLENWVAQQRERGISTLTDSANVCFISGPSRTGDIEMELILGVHGPGRVIAVIVR